MIELGFELGTIIKIFRTLIFKNNLAVWPKMAQISIFGCQYFAIISGGVVDLVSKVSEIDSRLDSIIWCECQPIEDCLACSGKVTHGTNEGKEELKVQCESIHKCPMCSDKVLYIETDTPGTFLYESKDDKDEIAQVHNCLEDIGIKIVFKCYNVMHAFSILEYLQTLSKTIPMRYISTIRSINGSIFVIEIDG